jgi:hypothetical protein
MVGSKNKIIEICHLFERIGNDLLSFSALNQTKLLQDRQSSNKQQLRMCKVRHHIEGSRYLIIGLAHIKLHMTFKWAVACSALKQRHPISSGQPTVNP